MTVVVIDADLVLWKASAAGEQRVIQVTHPATGLQKEFENRTAFKEFLKTRSKYTIEDYQIVDIQRPAKLETCFSNAKSMIESIKEVCKASKAELYIGKGDSFRKAFDHPTMYKGNRVDAMKPVHLKDVRQYLINTLKAKEVEVIEADDRLSIRAYEGYLKYRDSQDEKDKVVQATIDKDAKQCTGYLYNHDKMTEPKLIEGYGYLERIEKGKVDGYGRAWLYFQSLAGDTADAYKPSALSGAKFGDVGAYDLLKDCKDDVDALRVLAGQYKLWYPDPVAYTTWDGREVTKDWVDIADMYFNTARMLRWDGDRVNLREVFQNYGILPIKKKGE